MKRLIAEIQYNGETLLYIENTLSVNFGSLERGSVSDTTNWGCFSNTGEIIFIDKEKNFKSIISSFPDCNICIYYYYKSKKELLATFKVDDYGYDDESKKVSITLKDKIIDWQYKKIPEYYEFDGKDLLSIWADIFSNYSYIEENSAAFTMESTYINTPYIQESSMWDTANKICQASMTRCFCGKDGTPLFSDETALQGNNIVIRPRNILSIGLKTKNEKTRIDEISISQKNYKKHENESILSNKDGIDFSWFNVDGTTDSYVDTDGVSPAPIGYRSIKANWVGESGTSRIKPAPGIPSASYLGVRIYKNANIVDHIHNFHSVRKSISATRCSKGRNSSFSITEAKLSTDDQTYAPSKFSFSKKSKETIEILMEDESAFDNKDIFTNDQGIVGAYVIKNGNINLLGNYFSDEGDDALGSGDSLQSNELIQTESYIIGSSGNKSLARHIIDKTKEKYSNGIECVELEVTPSDYYDDKLEKIIGDGGFKSLFERYDIVTPYVMKNGIEKPYSTKDDGSPKSFRVIGIEYSYQGILRQKLHLQEVV